MAVDSGAPTTTGSSETTTSATTTVPTSSHATTGGDDGSSETGGSVTSDGGSGTDTGTSTGTGTGTGDPPEPDCDPLPAHTIEARDHLDSWGVVFSPGPSQDLALSAAKLDRIGVRRIRGHLAVSSVELWQAQQDQMIADGHARPTLKFDNLVVAYNEHPATWDEQKPAILAAAAAGLLTSIEGPNEMNNYSTGGGSHGVNDKVDRTNDWAGPAGNVWAWASAIHAWKTGLVGAEAEAMASVEVFAPSIASGLASDYASLPNLGGLVDFGNVHFYAGGGHSPGLEQPDDNPDVGYFANIYHWAQAAMTPGVPVVVSECGATTPPGEGYGPLGQAKYILNQLHEGAGIGARYVYIYTLFDPSTGTGGTEGNFGLFNTDGSEKPVVPALAAVKQLLSLDNDYDSPANDDDSSCFKPGYDGGALTVSGIGPENFASHVSDAVVYPKSDGSTLISVTNEPRASDAGGQDLTPAVVVATVHFGSTQSWHVYDVLGPTPLTPVESGTGDSAEVQLSGYPKYLLLDPPPDYQP